MRIYLDTEFVDTGDRLIPLSIGAVRDDGAELKADHSQASPWVRANVLPHLTGQTTPRAQVCDDLIAFAGTGPEWWGYCASYDYVVLSQLYGPLTARPRDWPYYARDIAQVADAQGVTDLPPQTSVEHHALADARWTRDTHRWLMAAEARA